MSATGRPAVSSSGVPVAPRRTPIAAASRVSSSAIRPKFALGVTTATA